jgi:hypothetical protein
MARTSESGSSETAQFIEGADHALFLDNSVRMSAAGHLTTGHALASAILSASIV